MQLQEYTHLFDENQDSAWLDKIDRRYAWIKKHLLEFESKFGSIFPQNWEVSERIAVQFCHMTRDDLSKLMEKRRHEIDVKLLLYAIQRTTSFENLLAKRFSGLTLENPDALSDRKPANSNPFEKPDEIDNPFEEGQMEKLEQEKSSASLFAGLIGKCFEPYLNIYIESIDRNLADLMEKFHNDCKVQPPGAKELDGVEGPSSVLSSCADLFVFYKKCMIQCTQLSTGFIMLSLTATFQKYLREYAMKLLQNNLPK